MNYRPYWLFYKTIFPFVAATGLISLGVFGVYWGYFLFCTLGVFVGFIGFKSFRKDEYYSYYNLGITRTKLFQTSFIINLLVGLPIFLVFLAFFILFFGKPSII
jgi:hypothetical protein